MWANAIPLVSLLAVVFGAGVVVAEVRRSRADREKLEEEFEKKLKELKDRLEKEIGEIKEEFKESARDQGRRIGLLEAEGKAEQRANEVRRELTGRHKLLKDQGE